MSKSKNLYSLYSLLIQIFLIPMILPAMLIIIIWIIIMELIVAKFLNKEANDRRNWELTYWHE